MTEEDPGTLEYRKQLRSEYLAERMYLLEKGHSYAGGFDKLVITLLSGLIALSVAYLKDVKAPSQPMLVCMGFSWLAAVSGMIASLLSLYWCQNSFHRDVASLDEHYEALHSGDKPPQRVNPDAKRVLAGNVFVLVATITSLLLLLSSVLLEVGGVGK